MKQPTLGERSQKQFETHALVRLDPDNNQNWMRTDEPHQCPKQVTSATGHKAQSADNGTESMNTKIIPVPPDGLCMYHCVYAAGDSYWMHLDGTSTDKQRQWYDAKRARDLRKRFIEFLAGKGLQAVARRLSLEGSRGYPSTDEIQHFAEMLRGRIEMVDLEMPTCPMTTYGEEGPILFRIAHQHIAHAVTGADRVCRDGVGAHLCGGAPLCGGSHFSRRCTLM